MAESSIVVINTQAKASEYNNLRKDVLDNAVGHTHTGGAGAGKTLDAAAIASGRFPVARLPAMTDEKIWKGTGGNVEEVDVYTDAAAAAAVEATGLAIATGKNIKFIANLADNTWSGMTAVLQAGENLTVGQLVYVKNDGKLWKAQSNSATTMPSVAVATGTINAEAWGEFLLIGFIRKDSVFTFTLGDMLYVSDTAAGAFDNVLPDGGDQVQVLGKCLVSTHIIYFNPSFELIETPL